MKKILYVLVGFVVSFVPALAAAQIYYPITYPTVPAYTPTPSYTASAGGCVALVNDLTVGSRGSEVTTLQTFIVNNNFPGSGSWMVTGYYGQATQAAVRNFQSSQGLPATGVVDSYTRSAIQRMSCGYSSGSVYTPITYGTNPYLNNYWYTSPSYSSQTYVSPYTYSYPYNYNNVASAYYGYTGCTGGYGNYTGCTSPVISYLSPSSGPVGVSVTVYGSGFSTQGNTVHFGTGIIANLSSSDGHSVSFVVPSQLVGYGSQPMYLGSYNVSVTNAAGYTSHAAPFVVTSLGSSGYGTPSVSNISGPTSLGIGMQGNWSITVHNNGYGYNGYDYNNNYNYNYNNYNNDGYLTTSVRWGDEGQYGYGSSAAAQSSLIRDSQTLTFTHVYQQPGTYTVTFTVTNSAGRTSSASATVYVSYNNQTWY